MFLGPKCEALRLEIRKRLAAREFTLSWLAKKAGMSQPTLSNFLNRKHDMRDENVARFMSILKITDQDLIGPVVSAKVLPGETIPIVRYQTASSARVISPDRILRPGDISALRVARLPSFADLNRQDWTRFVAIEASQAHADFMHPVIHKGATVVIDRHYQKITFAYKGARTIYAVAAENSINIGFLEVNGQDFILRPNEPTIPLRFIPLGTTWAASRLIIGRVCAILNDH
jgi:hypothetical protein